MVVPTTLVFKSPSDPIVVAHAQSSVFADAVREKTVDFEVTDCQAPQLAHAASPASQTQKLRATVPDGLMR